MRKVKVLTVLLTAGLLLRCAPMDVESSSQLQLPPRGEQGQESENSPDEAYPPTAPDDSPSLSPLPLPQVDYACFPGPDEQGLCLETLDKTEVQERHPQAGDFHYLNPYQDPGFPVSFDPHQYRPPSRLLDIGRWPEDLRLSPHFQISELLWLRRGAFGLYSNQALLPIEEIRNRLGQAILVTSAYRSPGHNGRVGGARWSRHTYGDALDFHSPGADLQTLAQLCLEHGASFYQLYRSHIHCDWRAHPLDPNFYPPVEGEAPRPALSRQVARQAFHAVVTQVAHLSDLHLTVPISQSAREVTLSAEVPQEDPGELLYEWTITLPNGHLIKSTEPRPQLRRLPGTYTAHAKIGGSIELRKKFRIER